MYINIVVAFSLKIIQTSELFFKTDYKTSNEYEYVGWILC